MVYWAKQGDGSANKNGPLIRRDGESVARYAYFLILLSTGRANFFSPHEAAMKRRW
jgi:hypothetical protein